MEFQELEKALMIYRIMDSFPFGEPEWQVPLCILAISAVIAVGGGLYLAIDRWILWGDQKSNKAFIQELEKENVELAKANKPLIDIDAIRATGL